MRVIFMGTPDFAVPSLEALLTKHEVVLVVTQPDKPKGRGKKMVPTPVKACALEHGIPVLQPEKVKEPEFVEQLRSYEPDLIAVTALDRFCLNPFWKCPNTAVSMSMVLCCLSIAVRHRCSGLSLTGKR